MQAVVPPTEALETNAIYCGDCNAVLSSFPDKSVDLIYADPPFYSGKPHERIWGDSAELRAFDDRRKGGIENYVLWMDPKLRECHRILKDTGSMYLHCDWHANAYLHILMDKIFIREVEDEIIWSYSKVGGTLKKFLKWHETIYRYTKTEDFTFNMDEVREPYSRWVLDSLKKDEKGYYYTRRLGRDPNIKRSGKTYINPKGKIPADVWELGTYTPSSAEALGYPTQKPEKLLSQIITVSSNPTDVVLDPFCGCGTAIAVAQKLGRRWIGIDISPTACKIMAKRMRALGVSIEEKDIIGLPRTVEELKMMEPFEFQNWVLQRLGGYANERKVGDKGIDGWLGDKPVQVKRWGHSVGRVEIDKFESAIRRENKHEGIFVAFEFGSGAQEAVAILKNKENFLIKLIKVSELVGDEKDKLALPALQNLQITDLATNLPSPLDSDKAKLATS